MEIPNGSAWLDAIIRRPALDTITTVTKAASGCCGRDGTTAAGSRAEQDDNASTTTRTGFGEGQDTTMNVYTQVLDGAARLAADRVGSELFRFGRERRRQLCPS